MEEQRMQRVAVFDFDGTIIYGDSVVDMLKKGYREKLVSLPQLLCTAGAGALYHIGLISPITSKRSAHRFLSKLPQEKRDAFLQKFAKSLYDRARPEALQQIRKHQENGEHVILCSASGDCYMQYVAPLLQVNALLCTPCDENGLPCGTNCRGEEKVRRVNNYLAEHDLQNATLTAGYGDTVGDAPILKKCQTPVLVRPRKKLKKLLPDAAVANWQDIKKS